MWSRGSGAAPSGRGGAAAGQEPCCVMQCFTGSPVGIKVPPSRIVARPAHRIVEPGSAFASYPCREFPPHVFFQQRLDAPQARTSVSTALHFPAWPGERGHEPLRG